METNASKISDMESVVMKVIWSSNTPLTYTDIRAALSKNYDLKSQVINTMLKRLVQKNVLKEEKRDVYYYSALIMEEEYIKSKTISLLDKVFGGNVKHLLSALVSYDKVTPEDLQNLQALWMKGREDA